MKRISKIILLGIFLIAFLLRFYNIDDVPHGLYIDEVSIALNAYDILTTGKDEHGIAYPLYFEAFGDYKLPVYIYLTSGALALFGKGELAVRFFSALAGVFTVITMYYFLNEIIRYDLLKEKKYTYLPHIGTFILAISSWHIHFSRGGFEANLALFFYFFACYLSLRFLSSKKMFILLLSFCFFAVSMYTYNAYKVISPVTVIIIMMSLIIIWHKHIKKLLLISLFFGIFISPILVTLGTESGSARFVDTLSFPEHKAKTIQEKLIVYPMVYVSNYMSFYSFDFLFNSGDGNNRHQLPGMGLFYKWELAFLIFGLFSLFKLKNKLLKKIVLFWILITPVLPALLAPSPHTLRALLLVIPYSILISLGIITFFEKMERYKKLMILFLIVVSSYEMVMYLHMYYFHYSNVNSRNWGGGAKETVVKASSYNNIYKSIYVDKKLSFIETYFSFYAPELHPIYVDPGAELTSDNGDKHLYIRPYYEKSIYKTKIDDVVLPGPAKEIYSEFWKL